MRVEQLMTKSPATCGSDNSLSQAAQTMWERDCGCLPVTATDQSLRLIGIITDRDICMAAHFHGKSLKDLRVSDAMVKEVYCCSPKDVLEDAEGIMRKARVRRLPIINRSRNR
jgi:CBS domain-containing protein